MNWITVFIVFVFRLASAEEILPTLTTEIIQKNQSGPQYQVGDRIQLNIRVPLELSQDLNAALLKFTDDKTTLDQQGWYLDPSVQIINGNLRFIASPIKTGKLILPELIILKDETHPIAKTTAINVDVAELTQSPNNPPALLDTISISLPLRFAIVGILILLLIFGCLYYFYKKHLNQKKLEIRTSKINVPPTPDHVIALRDLNLLYEQYTFSKENLKPVSFGVSQILKNFFSARFKVDAKESTTDEMMSLLKQESVPEQDLKIIRDLFYNLDIIKFTEISHHQQYQKTDYLEFKEIAKKLIESWAARGDQI